MNRRTKQIGVALALVAIMFFATWSFWWWAGNKAVSAAVRARTQEIVERHPEVQATWDRALQDQVLTQSEAENIAELTGERLDSES